MELEITTTVYIPVDAIIEDYGIDMNTDRADIEKAVQDYVCGLDDCEYYIIGDAEIEQIIDEIVNRTGEQLKMNIN